MDSIFARYIFGEAAGDPNMPQQDQQQQKQEPKMEIPGADKSLQPPDEAPDFTAQSQPNNQQGDTGEGDPQAAGAEGDPNAEQDPNAMGQEDPNAMSGAAPAGMGGPTIQSPEAQIDQDEKDVFSDLKPEQMIILKAELRDNYKDLYQLIVDTLDKINKISHTSYDDTMLDFIVKKFMSLKTQIKDTLIDTFQTRTYIANKIELSRFTFIFNQLTNMLTQIYQSRLKRQQKVEELNKVNQPKHDPEEFPLFTRGYETQ